MSFFRKFRHALGFEDDTLFDTEEQNELADDADTSAAAPAAASTDVAAVAEKDVEPDAIFEHVVAVFNRALPDFLARSVDEVAQRKLLYESLEQGLKDYIGRIGADADNRCEARWSAEQAGLRTEMETLRHKAEQVEHERAELKERQLSADRQKRALSERLRDLEAQVGRLEAEREQFDLENKSLLNKLKVAAVRNPDMEIAVDVAEPAAPAGPSQEELDALQAENARLREALAQAADRQAMADEMLADERKRLKVARQEVDDLQAITEQVEIVKQAIAERDATIERQRDNVARMKEQIATLKAAAAAAEQQSAAREAELRGKVEALQEALAAKPAVEEPEGEYAASAQETAEETKPARKPARKRKRKEEPASDAAPRITDADLVDVEAGFADHDWFCADVPPVADKGDRMDDFGYHAPEPKPRPYDDGMQMSLFD